MVRQKGAVTVEFVIVAPLLLLLTLTVFEFGWAFQQYNTMNKTVQDGARHVANEALSGTLGFIVLSSGDITATRNLVVYGNVGGSGDTLLPGWSTDRVTVESVGGDHVRVSASYDYRPAVMQTLPLFGYGEDQALTFTFRSAVEMRAL